MRSDQLSAIVIGVTTDSGALLAKLDSSSLLDAVPDAIIVVDPHGRIHVANANAAVIFGHDSETMQTMHVEALIPDRFRGGHTALRVSYEESPRARPMGVGQQLEARHADGTTFPVEISLKPLELDGIIYVLAAIRDVSQQTAARNELHRAQQDTVLAEDRERLARDLHDTVIQEVFGVGLSLQSVAGRIDDASVADRVNEAISDLDRVIRDIRTAIFGLTSHHAWGQGLKGEILRVAANARKSLGVEPIVHFDGPIDSINEIVADQLLPSLQEALSNVAKHAEARRCDITVTVEDEILTMVVLDDGVGPPTVHTGEGQGLENLASRASILGGTCSFGRAAIEGSRLEWTTPLAAS